MTVFSMLAEILFVGHSLVGPDLPSMVQTALAARGTEAVVEAQIINGAPLTYQWDHSADAEGVDGRARLASGKVDALILTEAIPLAGQMKWNDSQGLVALWSDLAWGANPQTQVLIYETWHSLKSGTGVEIPDDPGAAEPWASRIAADLPVWESLAAKADAARPAGAPQVRLVPAGQAMALAAKAARAGELPGITDITQLFNDDIHPNFKGLYLVAMVQAATLTGENPEGLPTRLWRSWPSRDAIISDELARAMQRIAWTAAKAQRQREDRRGAEVATPEPVPVVAEPAAPPVEIAAPAPDPMLNPLEPEVLDFPAIRNPNLGLGLAGVHDWSVQQPFLDVMKTARPWTAHRTGEWDGMDHAALAKGGWLDPDGWPKALPPGMSGISTLILTDLPEDVAGVKGHYILRWQGKGEVLLSGRAENQRPEAGGIGFDYRPGPGAVIVTLGAIDAADPIRNVSVIRADRLADAVAGQLFNPDWLARIRGVRLVRFMDWMMTNDSTLSTVADRPKPSDYTWARNGVPVEVMVALANELDADPWFTLPHLADDDLTALYARVAAEGLKPGRKAWIEYSNEVWNHQFAQARWAADQAEARWGEEGAGVQFYALRAAEVATIWADAFGAAASDRLVRVISTQTGVEGIEAAILDAPLVQDEGRPAPRVAFDALAVTGYFSALLGAESKVPMVRGWLADSRRADPTHPMAQAIALAAEELRDGRHSGMVENSVEDVLTRVWPYLDAVAEDNGLTLVMYEGGSHLVAMGQAMEDPEIVGFLEQLSYAPEIGALYGDLLQGWAGLTDAPFNAFVDVYYPTKWGSWGALRHLGDDNPRWQALAKG